MGVGMTTNLTPPTLGLHPDTHLKCSGFQTPTYSQGFCQFNAPL
jgi:hypothetical protein